MATAKKTTTSTAVAVKKPNAGAVVNIQEALAAQVAAMNERTAPASGISIRVTQDKQFALPNGQKTTELDLVIVDFIARNDFYEGAYDKNNITPPACFAIGTNPVKLVPSPNSPARQADTCAECPMNAFGSDGAGKACKNGRMLAVLPPDADEDTPMWTLKVSPTALKAFDSYVQAVARTFQTPPVGVVTHVSFNEALDYASLVFGDAQPNTNLGAHFSRQAEARELLNQEPDLTQFNAKPAAKPAAKPMKRGVVARR